MPHLVLSALASAMVLAVTTLVAHGEALLPEPKLGDDGLYHQDWFLQSFLDIGEDLAGAQEAGKGLVIVFEQSGCPYCREMHLVNLRDPGIVSQISSTFDILQLDLRGAREVTDTDGETLTERDLARKWGVVFTPTLLFLPKDALADGKPARDVAAAIMPGYFKPFHFATMFDYVTSSAFETEHFQDFLNARAKRLRDAGEDVSIWD